MAKRIRPARGHGEPQPTPALPLPRTARTVALARLLADIARKIPAAA